MKKLFSFVCALVCAMSLSAQAQTKTIYLSLGSIDWGKDGASFKEAISGKSMTAVDGKNGYYQVSIEETQTKVTFQRIGSNGTDVWNKQENLTIPDGKDLYTLTGWDNSGTWSVFADAPATQNYFALHGNFTGTWKTTEFTFSEDGATATLTMQLAASSYEFGARIGNSGNWTSNGQTITRDNNTTNFSESGSGNNKMTADVAGEYVFTYTDATKVLTVTYPAEEKKYTLTYGVIGENGTLTAMSGETAIESGAQVASATLTATPAEGYKVEGWYSNQEGTTALEGASGNTHTVVLSADMSVYVKFTIDNTPKDTVFFVNNAADPWTTVYCYAWTDGKCENATYPGVKLTEKCNYQLQGADVYFYVAEQGKYAKCLFNCGGDICKSGDLTWDAGKYFYKGEWKTRAELESDEPIEDVITYGIGSNKNNYNSSKDPMTVSDDKATATCTIQLTKDEEFEFSVVETTNGTSDKWLKNTLTTITRENNSAVLATNNDDKNTSMKVDATGTYTFVFTIKNSTITVTYPSSTPTALTNTEAENSTVKVIRDGQVLIVREGVTYNMMGQVIQ